MDVSYVMELIHHMGGDLQNFIQMMEKVLHI
jgi:hypothetical protein